MSSNSPQSPHPSSSWLPGEFDKLAALQAVLRHDTQLAFEKYWEELRKILPALVHADKSGFEPGSALDERTQLKFLAWARMFVRHFVGWADGSAHRMCTLARRAVHRGEIAVSDRSRKQLARSDDLSVPVRIKLGFKAFPAVFGFDHQLDASGQHWPAFLEIIAARHSATHPATFEDVGQAGRLGGLFACLEWYERQEDELMHQCRSRAGVPSSPPDRELEFGIATDIPDLDPFPYDEIAKDPVASLKFYRRHMQSLQEEASTLFYWSIGDEPDQEPVASRQFRGRAAVRGLIASLEGTLASTQRYMDSAEVRNEPPIPRSFKRRIKNSDRGPDRLTTIVEAHSSKFGDNYRPDRSSAGWRAVNRVWELRDRITHPKSAEELELSDSELAALWPAYEWVVRELGAALKLSKDKLPPIHEESDGLDD